MGPCGFWIFWILKIIKEHPKFFMGFSDITVLLMRLVEKSRLNGLSRSHGDHPISINTLLPEQGPGYSGGALSNSNPLRPETGYFPGKRPRGIGRWKFNHADPLDRNLLTNRFGIRPFSFLKIAEKIPIGWIVFLRI